MSEVHGGAPVEGAGRDPFAPIEASPRFAHPLAVLALLLGIVGPLTGLAPLLGPVGMATGLVAHVKGSRLGLPATVACGALLVVGMALTHYLR